MRATSAHALVAPRRLERWRCRGSKTQRRCDFLRNDAQTRVIFIDKIAAPVANKMFECGMFP
jgi:hypothetical protein